MVAIVIIFVHFEKAENWHLNFCVSSFEYRTPKNSYGTFK